MGTINSREPNAQVQFEAGYYIQGSVLLIWDIQHTAERLIASCRAKFDITASVVRLASHI